MSTSRIINFSVGQSAASSKIRRKTASGFSAHYAAAVNWREQARRLHSLTPGTGFGADSFVYTDYDGAVMNKAEFLADLKDPEYHASLVANESVRVISYPNVAIVVGTYHTKGKYKRQAFEHFGRFTDTWVYQNNKWQCVASHTNLLKK